ncbi:MAG: glycosyltransferase family 4 protein [Minisyncoccia bacterium]
MKILYVGTVLDSNWSGGEPVVATTTISMLKNKGYEVIGAYYKSKLGRFLNKIIGTIRAYFWISDTFIFPYLYYRKIIDEYSPDLIIAQYDFDSSIIKASIKQGKKIIVYIHIWWPICPKLTLFRWDDMRCTGYSNNNCRECILNSLKSGSFLIKTYSMIGKLIINDTKLHKKMDNRIKFLNSPSVSIVVPSKKMKDYLVREGIYQDKIYIIPNSINCNEFLPSELKEKIVGYYGGESHIKGYKIFFKLAQIIKSIYPEVRFVATGNFKDKSEYVEFVGLLKRDELKRLISKSRCTVVPGVWEDPFPLITLESMASGVPVVAFDVGSFKNIILNGETGFIVPNGAIDEMAKKIIEILRDDTLFSKLSNNSRRRACEEFSESKRISSFCEVIENK